VWLTVIHSDSLGRSFPDTSQSDFLEIRVARLQPTVQARSVFAHGFIDFEYKIERLEEVRGDESLAIRHILFVS
jgi:hypothetical protein